VSKRFKNILIFVLILAGLLVGILYSPIGNPNDYSSLYYYSVNPGVQFGGGIANVPKSNYSGDYADPDFSISDYQQGQKNNVSYNIPNGGNGVENLGSAMQVNSAIASNNTQSGGGSGGGIAVGMSSSRSSSKSNTTSQGYGFTSISGDLANNSATNTTKDAVQHYALSKGGTDPGGDPTGRPIPVGDGWLFLLVLAASYVIVKRYVLRHISHTI
jgi:hypothetical protein